MASYLLSSHHSLIASSSSNAEYVWTKPINHVLTKRPSFVTKIRSMHNGNESQINDRETGKAFVDRRELMASIATGSLSMALASKKSALADPIVPPDLSTCTPATVDNAASTSSTPTMYVDCCLLTPKEPIIDFKLPKKPIFHKRKPAHCVDDAYIAKYVRAYELMRALPSDDPRNLQRQADIHCAFCNGAYNQLGSNNKLQIHFSWLFLPWHRWYLYFHERILASLLNDPKFSLVYWNWDNQSDAGANIMPTMFTKAGTSLYDSKRNQNHLPPILNTLSLTDLSGTNLTNAQIIQDNLNVMYQSVVTASTPDLFMGKKYSNGDPEPNIGGTLENSPHTAIHAWTGDNRETYLEDMGNFYSAARDPIFYAHHSNVDRIWTLWNKIGGRRKDHTDPDFLNAEFIFYDENARMVRVTVKDALDSSRLGVSYEKTNADKQWLTYEPQPLQSTTTTPTDVQKIGATKAVKEAIKIGKKLKSLVDRPSKVPQELLDKGLDEEDVEEVLVLQDVMVPRSKVTNLAVFINLPDADQDTPLSCAEYVGSFVQIPHLFGSGMSTDAHKVTVRFGISDNIKRLGIKDLSTLVVTVVNKVGKEEEDGATLKGIIIEYE